MCVYSSALEHPARTLLSVQVLTGPDASDLVRRVDALPAGPATCADVVGRTVAIQAAGADGRGTTVVGDVGGCGRITNGAVSRQASGFVLSLTGGPGSGQGSAVPQLGSSAVQVPPLSPSVPGMTHGPGPS